MCKARIVEKRVLSERRNSRRTPSVALVFIAALAVGSGWSDRVVGASDDSNQASEVRWAQGPDELEPGGAGLLDALRAGRTRLEDRGITLELTYTADFFYNLRGGLNTSNAEQCRGLLGVGFTIDTARLGLWEDGTFFVSAFDNHGTDITERHVGDLQALNNADAPNDTRLYEFWYEHRLADDRLRIKVGKMDANEDFAAPDFGGEFVHSSSGFSPTIPFPTWPDPALGAVVSIEPADWLYLRVGIYDAEGTGTRCGYDTAFHSPDESITVLELGFRPRLNLLSQRDLPGTYRIGGFYHSGIWERFDDDFDDEDSPRPHRGNAGVYLVFDQALYREQPDPEEDEQGLGLFLQFGWAPSDYNEISEHYGGGLQYIGLIPQREEDITGLAVHHVNLSNEIQERESRFSETAIEVFHRFQLTPELSVKPDFHYIVNPGGNGQDSIVAGVRVEISL